MRALTSALLTIGFSCTSAEIYEHSFFFSYNRLGLLFWNPRGAADSGIRGRSRFFNPKQLTPTQASTGWRQGKKKNPLILAFFIYWQFTRTPSASHINTLAPANTGVYWSGLMGSGGQSGAMKSNRERCWWLEIAEGFHYGVLWWRECKRGILKSQWSSSSVSNDGTERGPQTALLFPSGLQVLKAASWYRRVPARLHAASCIALRMKPIALWWLYITSVDKSTGFMCAMSVCSEDVTVHENIPSTHFHMKYSCRINVLLPYKSYCFSTVYGICGPKWYF